MNIHASIWKHPITDFLFLFFPGVLAVILSHWIAPSESSIPFVIFAFIATGFLDSGHVYATLWRTYLRPSERQRSSVYLWTPVVFFILFFFWNWSGWSYLAAFVVYATVFHNVRQLLGISRWYQKRYKMWSPRSDLFLYALCVLPFIAFHFRSMTGFESYYGEDELFFYPQKNIYYAFVGLYVVVVVSWLGFEYVTLKKKKDILRTFSVFFAGFFYAAAFLWSENAAQVLFPLVVSHGFGYLALMGHSVHRLQPQRHSLNSALLLMMGTAFIFGGAEFFLEDDWFQIGSPVKAITTSLFLTPLFCHYYFDGFLWRRQHPDSARIY